MSTLRKRLVQLGGFLLAAALLVLALRGVDWTHVRSDLGAARWGWLVPMAIAALASHWLRAWRWMLFLETLPRKTDAPPNGISVGSAFGAVMIGYMANYAAPRLGEFVRAANVSTRHDLRFSGVLGTVASERVLDMVTLGAAFLSVPIILAGKLGAMNTLARETIASWSGRLAGHLPAIAVVAVFFVVSAAFLVVRLRRRPGGRFMHLLRSFAHGLGAVARTPHRGTLIFTTVGMWACYGLMAWLPFLMFSFDSAYGITFTQAWAIMLVGALGVVVPSPGGIGSYHFITIQALVLMFGFEASEAATYALVTHAGQLVLYVATGFIAMLVQGSHWSDLVGERTDV